MHLEIRKIIISTIFIFYSGFSYSAPAEGQLQIYMAREESPRAVMEYLLGLFGRELKGEGMSSRPVSGKFVVSSVGEVMAYFEKAYNVSWFEYGPTIYIYRPSSWSTRRVYVGEYDASTEWPELLNNAGLEQERFNVFYFAKKNELLISGPLAYIELVRRTFEVDRPPEEEPEPDNQKSEDSEIMIFPLRYASVEDRVSKLRDRELRTPGVLTVLKGIVGNSSSGGVMTEEFSLADYGLEGMNLGVLADPRTAVAAAGELVNKSVRGEEGSNRFFPGGVPKLEAGRKPSDPLSAINPPVLGSGSSSGVSMFADNRTNSILIRDVPSKYDYYKALIERLDVPVAMIEVEAMLVEIDTNNLDQLGVEFGLNESGSSSDFTFSFSGGVGSIVRPGKFVARLRALQADSKARVLSRPTIVTQNNVPAFIDLSETLYLQLEGERVADVKEVTAGSLLEVTPRLVSAGDSNEIFIRVEIQDGTLQDQTQNSGLDPRSRNTSLSTQAVIDRDRAILIGGYNREMVSESERKVPLLGSLPILGAAFRSVEQTTNNVVRMFLITPRVLQSPAHFTQSTRDAVTRLKETFEYQGPETRLPEPVRVYQMEKTLNLGGEQ